MNSNPIPEYYGVTHLFLVTGRNPLPNYVAAQLLLKPDSRLYLVCTKGPKGTEELASRVAVYFPAHDPKLIPVDPLDTQALRNEVAGYLQQAQPGTIGLNYTGGTKLMAIHTRWAIENFCRESDCRKEPIFSYLDADTLELAVEPCQGHEAFRRQVMDAVTLPPTRLLDLHGINLRGKRLQTEPVHLDLIQSLVDMHASGNVTWPACRKILFEENQSWQTMKSLLCQTGATPAVVDCLDATLQLADGERVNLQKAAERAGLETRGDLKQFLEGGWLEQWVLACARDLGYEQRACNVVGYAPRRFEIDVMVMRGYRLFAISCTAKPRTSDAKLKLFEIYARARQIGGEEARNGLVCLTDDSVALQQELEFELNSVDQVRVFGQKELGDLKSKLKEWFETI